MKRKVEIEGKEAVQLPNGQSYMAEGPSHENGGIPIELPVGTRVYSKRVKKDGKSMAERKAKRDRDLKSMVNTVMDNPFDGPSEAAMRRMMTAYAQQEAADMDTMERAQMKKEAMQSMQENLPDDAFSSPDQMKCGGKVKKYKKGGIVIDPEKKGTFKAQATRMGMSVAEAADYILNNPDEFSPKMRKKANFANNFAMAYGGEIMDMLANGGMIKRADGSYSKRGLWDNIRDNISSGKEPTPEMLEQERKIKAKMMYGGKMYAEGGEVDMELEDIINAMIDARLDERMGGQPEGMEQSEMEEEEGEQMEEEGMEEEMGYGGKLKRMGYGGKVNKMADGGKVTHQLAVESPDGKNWFAFPMVDYDMESKRWVKFADPWEAYDYHEQRGTLLKLPSKDKDFAMYYGREGLMSHGGKRNAKFDAMAQKINKENANIPWVSRGMNPSQSPSLSGEEFDQMDSGVPTKQKMAEGGVVKNGTTKRSTRKGKKMMVYMDGSWHHFGDSSMDDFRTHKSEKRKKAFYDRHKKNLQGDSPRAKAFRVYARKTWEKGGTIPKYIDGTPQGGVPNTRVDPATGNKITSHYDDYGVLRYETYFDPQTNQNYLYHNNPYKEGEANYYIGDLAMDYSGVFKNATGAGGVPVELGNPVYRSDVRGADGDMMPATIEQQRPDVSGLPRFRTDDSIPTDNTMLIGDNSITLGKPAGSAIQATPTPDASSWMQGINSVPKQRVGTRIGNAIGAASQFIGSNMGPLGIAVGALGPLAATVINRLGDKTNESFFEDYGREGLAANAASMRGVEASRQMGLEDIARQQAGSVAQTRGMGSVNAARGVQQMAGAQAMRASTVANQQATTQQAGLMGQRANLLNTRDAQVMQARQAADQANIEDRDAFFTALSSNLSNLGTGMMYAARNRKPAQTAAQKINAKVLE